VSFFPLGLGSGFGMDTWEPLRPDIPTRGPFSAPDRSFRSVASPDIDSLIETCPEVKMGLVVVVSWDMVELRQPPLAKKDIFSID